MPHQWIVKNEVTNEYVARWADTDDDFEYTKHKGLAHRFDSDTLAREALSNAIPMYENRLRFILVPAKFTAYDIALAALSLLPAEQRYNVFHEFCVHCGGDSPSCCCMMDD